MRAKLFLLILSIVSMLIVGSAIAQNSDETTRKLWDTAFINNTTNKPAVRRKQRSYRVATPRVSTENVAPDSVVGVTIWRLRPAVAADSGERIIVHEGSEAKQWLPERISADTKLVQGDKLRISIEGARKGYLYVIDREQYADGSVGEPYLIFPTTRTLKGDNQVDIGRLTEIPAQDDDPPYFTVKKSRADHIAEVVSVLVSPAPLEGFKITDQAQKLSEEQVAVWEKQWSTGVGFLEMEKTAGQAWTREERDAGGTNTRALTANGPAPQLLFYRAAAKPNEPLFVKLHLWYRGPTKRTANH
ncbi:MAG: hypothetical protein C5B55_01815 [Blastocatellia bacterium]|nr:MAG: hypothetical protein C5B55_01815 [Blastocatellia bacterium]